MDLQEVLSVVSTSAAEDWFHIPCWGAGSGPSYRNRFEDSSNTFSMESHSDVATFRGDVSITLAWGLEDLANFRVNFSNPWPSQEVSSFFVDIFYHGALIYRTKLIHVDGARACLPVPTVPGMVSRTNTGIGRLIDSMSRVSDFDRYFRDARFQISD